MVKVHPVTVSFVTKDGVHVTRTIPLSDKSRANAEYRAQRLVPATATNVRVVK